MANPTGTNSPVAFDQFTRQIPYGEKKVQGDLQRSVPLAGGSAAATPINLPRNAGRRAQRRPAPQRSAQPQAAMQAPPQPAPPPSTAELWQQITNVPGITPLAFDYLQRAEQQ